MPTDSNGNYSLPAGYEAVTGETIEAAQHNEPLEDIAAGMTARVMRNGTAPMTANLNMDSHRITNVTDPSSAQDAATKAYVDGIALNVGKRVRVRVATTANITISTALNSGDTLDGIALANGDLVLVKDQSTASQNGVYTVAASPARTPEYDTYNELPGSLIAVQEGTANADTLWICTSNEGGTIDSTAIAFSQVAFNAATETLAGVVELATNAEAQAGLDTARATTPANLAAATVMQGRHSIWVPASAFTPMAANGAGSSTFDSGNQDITFRTIDFDTSSSEAAFCAPIAMPKSWNEGTVTFKIYWTNTGGSSTQTVAFNINGRAFSDDDAFNTAYSASVSATDTYIAQNDLHVTAETAALTIDGSPAAEDLVLFRVSRDVANDNLSGDALLIGMMIYVTLNAATDA